MNIPSVIIEELHNACNSYINVIEKMLPTLKRSFTTKKVENKDKNIFIILHKEASDHLHNLKQSKIDLDNTNESDQTITIEICMQIFSKVLTFIQTFESRVNKTNLLSE